ncbi:MAG: hypothetical protein QNK11_00405 [Legionella sp.]|nr:hypothetical protein [Legionella sp.]
MLRTPAGFIPVAVGVIFFASISAYANSYYNDKSPEGKAKYRLWQMFRDAVKGFKNTIRGVMSLFATIQLLAIYDLTYLLLPVSLSFGILSIFSRLLNRSIVNARKDMQDENEHFRTYLNNKWGTYKGLPTLPKTDTGKLDLEALAKNAYGFRYIEDECKLYYIHYNHELNQAEPVLILDKPTDVKTFLQSIQFTHRIYERSQPSLFEWNRLLPSHALDQYKAFLAGITKKVAGNKQSTAAIIGGFLTAIYGGLADGLYMYMGLSIITAMAPTMLLLIAPTSLVYALGCSVGRTHEEKDFQRTLRTTEQKTNLTLITKKIELKLVNHETITTEDLGELINAHETLYQTLKTSKTDAVLIGLRQALSIYIALVCNISAIALVSLVVFATPLPAVVALFTAAIGILLLIGSAIHSLATIKQYTAAQTTHYRENLEAIQAFNCNREIGEIPEFKYQPAPGITSFGTSDASRAGASGGMKDVKFELLASKLISDSDNHDLHNPLIWLFFIPSGIVFASTWLLRSLTKNRKDLFDEPDTKINTRKPVHKDSTQPPANPGPSSPSQSPRFWRPVSESDLKRAPSASLGPGLTAH